MNTKADINERGLCHQCGYGVLESADPRIGDWSCERCGTPVYVGDQMTHAAADHALRGLTAERDAAIARAEAAEAQVAKLREALTELLAVAQQAVDNVIVTCDRMWVSDAELADMARRAIARAALEPAHD